MLSYWVDKWVSASLRARYERRMQEQVLSLLERQGSRPESEEAGDWQLVGGGKGLGPGQERGDERQEVRRLVQENPYARNIMRLLEAYVVGDGFGVTFSAADDPDGDGDSVLLRRVSGLWRSFLEENRRHFSYQEYARRVWRDGECFLRVYETEVWPPAVRFVDPEWIGGPQEEPGLQGIETAREDVERVEWYLRTDPRSGELVERIAAEEMLHSRCRSDSNEKRGRSFFSPLAEGLRQYTQWQETELQARKLQASIVLWRRVQGGPLQAQRSAEQASTGSGLRGEGDVRSERIRPGTILTTSAGTEIKYLQPDTNFGDAVPLGRMILLGVAAGAGIPEFMLTSDAANGNYASTMVAEGPAVKLFQSEQQFFTGEFTRLWRRVLGEAVRLGLLSESELATVELRWSYPQLVSRDRPRERHADVELLAAGVLSRAEVQRREHLDPRQIQGEIAAERTLLE